MPKVFTLQKQLILLKNIYLAFIKVIDKYVLAFKDIIEKTMLLKVTLEGEVLCIVLKII